MSGQGEDVSACERILADLESVSARLSPQLERAAQYLVERPDEIAFTSMRKLAERAGVQPATMVRLAQAIGFDGYESFRAPFRAEMNDQPTGLGARARKLLARTGRRGGGRALARLAGEMMAADRENLSLSLEAIGTEELADAARVLAGSRRIYVVGQRSLYSAAFYVWYACSLFRDDVVLVDGKGGTFADGFRGMNADDAMLVYGFEPYTRGTIEAASLAASHGAAIVAVTDSLISPLSALTRHMLLVGTDTPALFRSVVPAMTVSQVLVAQILAQGGQDALSRLAESEALHEGFDTYWQPADDTPSEFAEDDDAFEAAPGDVRRLSDNRTD